MEGWKGTSRGKIIFKKEKKVGGIILPDIMNYCRATIIKTIWH